MAKAAAAFWLPLKAEPSWLGWTGGLAAVGLGLRHRDGLLLASRLAKHGLLRRRGRCARDKEDAGASCFCASAQKPFPFRARWPADAVVHRAPAGVYTLVGAFAFFFLGQTRGRTLEEIEATFR